MKKKYFCKYLPVDGESTKDFKHVIHLSTGEVSLISHPITNPDYNKKEFKPAKLFLCSEDIKLNDKYFHDSFCPYPDGEIADTNTKVMDAHMMITNEGPDYEGDTSFKVIGQISPDALSFVKEGDEFDEEDWKWVTYSFDMEIIIPKDKMIDINQKDHPISLQIKGPCGHFH